jgi:GNAT superfamily N-acetyltransferase
MKSFKQYIFEDIELISGIRRATRQDMNTAQDEFDYSNKKNLGKIHKDYSLHKSGGDFYITHDSSKKVVGHITNQTPHKSKRLEVEAAAVHPEHTKKKIGHSLAVAAYKHLHKQGYTIHSGNEQSAGGASIWRDLMNDPDTSEHVYAVHHPYGGKKTELGQASKLHTGDIWQSGSGEVRRKAASKGIRMHKYQTPETDRAMDTYLELRPPK